MSKGGRCKGWKLEGGWREGWCWAGEEAPGRGRAREPRQRSFSKSPTARGMHRGASLQRGLCFSLKPGSPAPKIRQATPLGSVSSSAALTERAYEKGWPHGDPIRGLGLMGREKKVSLSLLLQPCFREQLRAECLDRGSLPSLGYK